MSKDIVDIKVSDIFKGFPDFEEQQPRHVKVVCVSDKPRNVSEKETEIFHRKKPQIMRTIYSKIDNRETLHGNRALNIYLPSYLDRHTRDADIFTPVPYIEARETEKALDEMMRYDAFRVEQAKHKGTWKVIAHATGETYADYTKPPRNLQRKKIYGINYPTLNYIENHLKETLADPTASHRHVKDQDALNRIQIYKRRLF